MNPISQRLAHAKAKLFGTAAVEIPVPFEIPCDCGHKVAGIRKPRIQFVDCSACGQSLFVLPVNLYPATRRTASLVVDGGLAARAAAAARELAGQTSPAQPASAQPNPNQSTPTDPRRSAPDQAAQLDTPDATSSPRRPAKRSRSTQSDATPATAATKTPAPTTSAANQPKPVTPIPLFTPQRTPFRVRIRRTFTPFRLLAAGCFAALVLTGAWIIHQQQIETARRTWRREIDAANTAEAERNRPALLQALRNAIAAANTLNKQDDDANTARALLLQCEAINQLSAVDPIDVLSKAAAPNNTTSPAELNSALRGLQLLFHATPQDAADPPPAVLLDLPLIIQGRTLQIAVDSPVLHKLAQQYPGQAALFVASIKSCRLEPEPGESAHIELDPQSITLLTSEFLANEAGIENSQLPELPEILKRQTALLSIQTPGSTPPTDSPAP